MSKLLQLRFRETTTGLEVEFNVPLHSRFNDELCVMRGELSSAAAKLDDRDTPLLKSFIETLFEIQEGIEEPLFVRRYKMHIKHSIGCAVDLIERIKNLIIDICISCGKFNVVEVTG